jgi:hypothetical protein
MDHSCGAIVHRSVPRRSIRPNSSSPGWIARLQRHRLRNVLHEVVDLEEHTAGVAGLQRFAVDVDRYVEGMRIGYFVRCDQVGPERARAVDTLGAQPLTFAALEVAGGDVHEHAVTRDMLHAVPGLYVSRARADDECQFDFVVQLLDESWVGHGVAVAGEHVGTLAEQQRRFRHFAVLLFCVVPVVESQADDFGRIGHRRAEADFIDGVLELGGHGSSVLGDAGDVAQTVVGQYSAHRHG